MGLAVLCLLAVYWEQFLYLWPGETMGYTFGRNVSVFVTSRIITGRLTGGGGKGVCIRGGAAWADTPHRIKESLFCNTDNKIILLRCFTAYTIAKYGMSMCALGMAEELKPDGVAVNTLWPRTGRITFFH